MMCRQAMQQIDYKKTLKHLYQPSAREVVQVDVPPLNYLMVDGQGDPNTAPAYAEAVEALFTVSYTLKFMVKKGPLALDYGVMPLEGLWWADEWSAFVTGDRSHWQWTMMIMQPEVVTPDLVSQALADVQKRKNPPAVARLRFETSAEGTCAQLLHIGPFSAEGPTIEKVHAFIDARGRLAGKHHEIYLSDIRKAAPAKWRTIIRQGLTVQ